MRTQKYDEAQVESVLDLRRSGCSMALIGKKLGMSKGAVVGMLDRLAKKGHAMPSARLVETLNSDRNGLRPFSDAETDRMIELLRRREGATIFEVMSACGGNTSRVAWWVTRLQAIDPTLPGLARSTRVIRRPPKPKDLRSPRQVVNVRSGRRANLIPSNRGEVERMIEEAMRNGKVTRLKPGYAYGVVPSDRHGLLTLSLH